MSDDARGRRARRRVRRAALELGLDVAIICGPIPAVLWRTGRVLSGRRGQPSEEAVQTDARTRRRRGSRLELRGGGGLDHRQPPERVRADDHGRRRAGRDVPRQQLPSINSLPNIMYYQLLVGVAVRVDPGPAARASARRRRPRGAQASGPRVLRRGAGARRRARGSCSCAPGRCIVRAAHLGVPDPAAAAAARQIGSCCSRSSSPRSSCTGRGERRRRDERHGRFALAAGAPDVENAASSPRCSSPALIFGTAGSRHRDRLPSSSCSGWAPRPRWASTPGVVARGAPHGPRLVPRRGWRDPEVRVVVRPGRADARGTRGSRRSRSSRCSWWPTGCGRPRRLPARDRTSSYLPAAVVTWPIARAALPQLARLDHAGEQTGSATSSSGRRGWHAFITMPAALAYLVLAVTARAGGLVRASSATPSGVALVRALARLARPGVIGDGAGSSSAPTRSTRGWTPATPLRSMVVRGVSAGVPGRSRGHSSCPCCRSSGLRSRRGASSAPAICGARCSGTRRSPVPTPGSAGSGDRSPGRGSRRSRWPARPRSWRSGWAGRCTVRLGEVLAVAGGAAVGAAVYFGVQRRGRRRGGLLAARRPAPAGGPLMDVGLPVAGTSRRWVRAAIVAAICVGLFAVGALVPRSRPRRSRSARSRPRSPSRWPCTRRSPRTRWSASRRSWRASTAGRLFPVLRPPRRSRSRVAPRSCPRPLLVAHGGTCRA